MGDEEVLLSDGAVQKHKEFCEEYVKNVSANEVLIFKNEPAGGRSDPHPGCGSGIAGCFGCFEGYLKCREYMRNSVSLNTSSTNQRSFMNNYPALRQYYPLVHAGPTFLSNDPAPRIFVKFYIRNICS